MTSIVYDYADIRSHMRGDDSFLPKAKVDSAPVTVAAAELPPLPQRELGWLTPQWITVRGRNMGKSIYMRELERIIGVDPAKPGSDKSVVVVSVQMPDRKIVWNG